METEEAIARLSNALSMLGAGTFDKDALKSLLKDVVDEKHSHYIEQGLIANDRGLLMHGIVGSLSHYEAEKHKQKLEKKFETITDED